MDNTHQSLLQPHFEPDERLVWSGKPDAKRMLWNYLLPGWGGTLIIGVALALFGVDILLLALFIPGMLVITLLMGLFWIYPDARHTLYALTTRRALVVNTRSGKLVDALEADNIGPIQRFTRPDGSGDLLFASEMHRRSRRRGKTRHFGFIGIHDVHTVEQHLHEVFPHTTSNQEEAS